MAKDWVAEIAAEIAVDDLPESYQAIAEIVGKDLTLKLSQYLGGSGYYFRKLDGMMLYKRDEKIRAAFTGSNHKELAHDYNLTERQIRNILQVKPFVQTTLFEEDKR